MKVLYIMHSSSKYEGANKSLLSTVTGLKDRGIKPFVLMPETLYDTSIYEELTIQEIPYQVLKYYKPIWPNKRTIRDILLFVPRFLRSIFFNHITLLKLKKMIRETQIDLIHTNVGPMLIGFKISNSLNIPHLWHLREYQDLDFKFNTYYKKEEFIKLLNVRNNHPIPITIGLAKHFRLPIDKVIYNGVLPQSKTVFTKTKKKRFIYVGNLASNKGIEDLIEAFSVLHDTNTEYKLCIAGDTGNREYKQKLEDRVKHLNLTEHIIFLGKRDDVIRLMSDSKALIVPSIFEGFGRITAEAMFSGCLVIGRNTGGTREILEPNNLGILFDNQQELIEAMIKVATAPIESYYPLIQRAILEAQEKYSVETNVNKIYNLYNHVLNH